MRTTVDITEDLLRRAKQRAAEEHTSLREIVEAALRAYLGRRTTKSGYRLQWRPDGGRQRPGVDLDDRDALFDVMDGRE